MVRKLLAHSFVRYVIVGVLSLGVDYGGLLFGYHVLHMHLAVATTISFFIGLICNFLLTKFWTFKHANHSAKHSIGQAVLVAMLVCFNLLVTNVVITQFNKIHIGPEISKLVTTAMVTLWNYVLYKKVIFKQQVPIEDSTYVPEDYL
jgi:putative flippase GtrA